MTIQNNKPLRAYALSDRTHYVETSIVVFARTAREARRHGHINSVEYIDLAARRVPKFDAHAPGPVPMQALLNEGWWQECGACRIRVDGEDEPIVNETNREVYCDGDCEASAAGYRLGHRYRLAEFDAAENEVRRRWPDAMVCASIWNYQPNIRWDPAAIPQEGSRIVVRVAVGEPGAYDYGSWIDGDKQLTMDEATVVTPW